MVLPPDLATNTLQTGQKRVYYPLDRYLLITLNFMTFNEEKSACFVNVDALLVAFFLGSCNYHDFI